MRGIGLTREMLVSGNCAKHEGADAEMVEKDGGLPALNKVGEEETDGRNPPAEVCCVEVEHDAGLWCGKSGLQEHANQAAHDTNGGKAKLEEEGLVLAEDGELGTALLDDEVENPVDSFTEPPAGSSSLVSHSILLNIDVVKEGVENVLLDGDDSLDDEGQGGDNREGVLGDVDEAEGKILILGLPITLEHSTTKKEEKRLGEDEKDGDDCEAAAVNDTLGHHVSTHHDRRDNHPIRNMTEYAGHKSARADHATSDDYGRCINHR